MSRLLLALLLLVAPATAQDWDPCNTTAVNLPPIPPCEAETHRDIDAVVLCVSVFWQLVGDAEKAHCLGGTLAIAARDDARRRAITDYMGILSLLEREHHDCVADCDGDPGCIQGCEALYLVKKKAANELYSETMLAIDATFENKKAELGLALSASVQLAVTGFVECIEGTAPCK